MSPENVLNYKQIGDKLLSQAENLDNEVLKAVLERGLKFSTSLIKQNSGILANLQTRSDEFKKYFPYAILLRMTGTYEDSRKRNLSESKAKELFSEFKYFIIDEFGINQDKKNDLQFEDRLIKAIKEIGNDESLFPEGDLLAKLDREQMVFVRNWAVAIIPENPIIQSKDYKIDHPLD